RDERARVAEQEELPVPLAVVVRRIVYDDGLGVAAADGATVVRGALVGDDDVVRESAGHREEPLEDPRLVADRRDHDDADGLGGGHVRRIRRREGNGSGRPERAWGVCEQRDHARILVAWILPGSRRCAMRGCVASESLPGTSTTARPGF